MSLGRVLIGCVAALVPVPGCSLFAPSDEELMGGDEHAENAGGAAGAAEAGLTAKVSGAATSVLGTQGTGGSGAEPPPPDQRTL